MAIQNAKTRGQTRIILGRAYLGPEFVTGTASGGSTTTIVDSALSTLYAADYFNNRPIRNQTKDFITYVSDYASGTFTIPTQTASAASDVYEVWHRGAATVEDANDAIDLAIQSVVPKLMTDTYDDTLAYQKSKYLYIIPSGFSRLAQVAIDVAPQYRVRHRPYNWDTLLAHRDDAARTLLAQSFKLLSGSANPSMQLGDVFLFMAKVGSPTGNLSITIEADSGGSPDGTALATSANVDITTLTAEVNGIKFTFTVRPVLSTSTTYWIVLAGTNTISSTAYAAWCNDSGGSGYGDGSTKIKSATTWSAQTGDLAFFLRNPQPQYMDLTREKHWRVIGGATPYVEITEYGAARIDEYDGQALRLFGQSAPSLPTADSTTLAVPYDYVVAHAGLELHNRNGGFLSNRPDSSRTIAGWLRKVEEASRWHNTLPYPGSYKVRDL